MARIKYSALVDSIRGTIQGTTFQSNAYGYTIKGKPNMLNPNTANQNRRKSTFSAAVQAWKNISGANRAAWDAYANAYPIPARKNPSAYLSGFNAFCRWHGLRFVDNSVVLANPSGAQGTVALNSTEVIINAGAVRILLDVTTTNGPWRAFVSLTRSLQVTQTFIKGWTRFIQGLSPAEWPDWSIDANYVAQFGTRPAVGDQVGCVIAFLNTTNGQIFFQPPQIVTVTV